MCDKIKKSDMDGHVGYVEEYERCIQSFGTETAGKKPLAKPRHRG
jgi:hypothetical protein